MATNKLSNLNLAAMLSATLTGGSVPAYISSAISEPPTQQSGPQLTVGNASGQVDVVYCGNFTITAGTPLTINLGTCLDPLGGNASMLHVAVIIVANTNSSGGNLTIGGGTDPVLGSDVNTIMPGGVIFKINQSPGYPVVASASDTLTITASIGTVTGRITVLGRDA